MKKIPITLMGGYHDLSLIHNQKKSPYNCIPLQLYPTMKKIPITLMGGYHDLSLIHNQKKSPYNCIPLQLYPTMKKNPYYQDSIDGGLP